MGETTHLKCVGCAYVGNKGRLFVAVGYTDPDAEETAGVERSQESPREHQQGTRGSVISEVGGLEGRGGSLSEKQQKDQVERGMKSAPRTC